MGGVVVINNSIRSGIVNNGIKWFNSTVIERKKSLLFYTFVCYYEHSRGKKSQVGKV